MTNDLVTTAGGVVPRLISEVRLERSADDGSTWSQVRRVEYTYYTGRLSNGTGGFTNGPHGRLGDLKLAEVKNPAGAVLDTKYYRYNKFTGEGHQTTTSRWPTNQHATTGGPSGNEFSYNFPYSSSNPSVYHRFVMSGLKAVVEGAALDRLAAAFPAIEAATDEQIKPFVNNFFKYERWADHVGAGEGVNWSWRTGYRLGSRYRVIEEIAQGAGCSTCFQGQGTFKVDYHANY